MARSSKQCIEKLHLLANDETVDLWAWMRCTFNNTDRGVECGFYPVKDALTGLTRMVSLVIDVTERKQAEIALKQSEDRARFIVRLDDALRTIIDADEVSRTAAGVLAEQLRCDRALPLLAGAGNRLNVLG
jgi:PAS domain-containing protein